MNPITDKKNSIDLIRFFTITFLLLCFTMNSQNKLNPFVDSIVALDTTERVKIRSILKFMGRNRYVSQTRPIIDSIIRVGHENADPWILSNSYYSLGNYYFYRGELDSSLTALDLAEENLMLEENPDALQQMLKASSLTTRGGIYSRSGDVLLAIETALKAKSILEKLDTIPLDSTARVVRKGKLMTLNNSLANLYLNTEDHELALKAYEETFLLAKKLNDLPAMSIVLSNQGELLYQMKRLSEALEVSKRAKKLKQEAKLPERFVALSNRNIGKIYNAMDSVVLARNYLDLALEQSKSNSYERGIMLALVERGQLFLKQGDFDQAKEDCSTAYDISIQLNESDSKINSCDCLYKVEKSLGNTGASLVYFEKYTQMKDSIFNEKNVRNLTKMSMQYDFDKKQLEQKIQADEQIRKRNRLLAAAGVLLLFSLFAVVFYRKRLAYKQTIAEQEQSLKNQEILKLKQENRLTAMNSVIEGQEKERTRIAKDLHDGLGGLLSSVKSHFLATIDDQGDQKTIEKTKDLIDNACAEVRRISHNMMPHALAISGLEDGLRDISERLELEGYEVTLEIAHLPKLDETKEVMVYRMVQEIIANMKKHAAAKSVFIQLYSQQNQVYLTIEDDGKGFDLEKAKSKKGLGLENIEGRVTYLKGDIVWDTGINKGTSININFAA